MVGGQNRRTRPTGGLLWRLAWEIWLVSTLTGIGLTALFLVLYRLVGGQAMLAQMTVAMGSPGFGRTVMLGLVALATSLFLTRAILWFHVSRAFRDF
ncbi:MAG: hypothetical protein AAGD47_15120 [Pseudomonadota bacterium]